MSEAFLGVPRVLNAGGAQSRLGGSILSERVRAAMTDAGTAYVDIEALHDAAGRRLAALTNNEAAWVSAGSAAGIMVAVAACIAGDDPERAAALPRAPQRRPVAVWRGHLEGELAGADAIHANGYLNSIAAGGGHVRVIDELDDVQPTDAAALWFPGMYPHPDEDGLLDRLIAAAHRHGVPVIVDAADQVPPRSRLWSYTTGQGADLAIFSGGKGVGGPTSSGLVVGSAELVAACRANSGTEHGVGRTAKVGREEILGLLAAVDELMSGDEDAEYAARLGTVRAWAATLAPSGLILSEDPRGHCGQAIPRLLVRLPSGLRECRDAIVAALWERSPRVAVLPAPDATLAVSPQLLSAEETDPVIHAIADEWLKHRSACASCARARSADASREVD